MKKFFLVLFLVMSAIPILFLFPSVHDSFPNRFGVILGIAPLALFLATTTQYEPWETGALLCGIFLMAFGILFHVSCDALVEFAGKYYEIKQINDVKLEFMTFGINLWKRFLPNIDIGFGFSIISRYILTSEPQTAHDVIDEK